MVKAELGSKREMYSWRKLGFLEKVLTERPARWLPPDFKNYDELLSGAADRAVKRLEYDTTSSDPDDWAWKRFNELEMLHPIGREGILKKLLSKSGQAQAGTLFSPRAASHRHGPSERF